jgi:hypothetical protein
MKINICSTGKSSTGKENLKELAIRCVTEMHGVIYSIFQRALRFTGKHTPKFQSATIQQPLSPSEENTLMQWLTMAK